MAFRIGFMAEQPSARTVAAYTVPQQTGTPRRSVVQVRFPDRGLRLAYYNDRFDLHRGDIVFVEGKLEGKRGRVEEVSYNFKIKVSDYKRVIAVADTEVHGRFHMAGSHVVSFDRTALPFGKAATWYMAPRQEDDEYASGVDDSSFLLNDLKGFKVSEAIAERGRDYYMRNKVVYISVDGTGGSAIVEGQQPLRGGIYLSRRRNQRADLLLLLQRQLQAPGGRAAAAS